MSSLETMGEGVFQEETTQETQETSTPTEEVAQSTESAAEETPALTQQTEEVPAFVPNHKFTVMGKEMEIPEKFRALIADADSEKEVREIFEKAYGLDHVKGKYETTKSQLEAISNEYNPIKKDLQTIKTFIENNDLDSFFGAFGLTDEQLITHAMRRLEYHQMSPEKRQEMDAQTQKNAQFYKTQQELAELKSAKAAAELNDTVQELQNSIQAAHVAPIAESFNARAGQPDAFEKAVITFAQNYFMTHKVDLSVPQAIEGFIKTFGLQAASQPATPQAAPASAPAKERQQTLPKTGSGTVAPVKAKVKSIDDIRKLSQQQI